MLSHCLRMFSYGSSYRIATMMFPREIRDAVLKLYSFVRVPDNMVDEICRDTPLACSNDLTLHYQNAKTDLTNHYQHRQQVYTSGDQTDPVFGEYVTLFKKYNISYEYSQAFFESMLMDCDMHRYHTYEQLDTYMYGSAVVIGLMMCEVMGTTDTHAIPYAHTLGDAMQMTNFLRDINEDYIDLDRIYLPEHELLRYNLTHHDIQGFCKVWNDFKNTEQRNSFQAYMKDQISIVRSMYREAEKGYEYLPKEWRRAVELSAKLYEGILDKIEKNHYDVFTKSARTNFLQKIRIVVWYIF